MFVSCVCCVLCR